VPTHVTVTVPATTANLGPGFDCLGMALGLFNTIEVWAFEQGDLPPADLPGDSGSRSDIGIGVIGEGAGELAEGLDNLILQSMARVFDKAGRRMPPMCARAINAIPLGAGLGSSAATAVGGVVAANAVLGSPFSRADLLRMAVEIEGHPDNAAPALLGGLVVVVAHADGVLTHPVSTPALQVVVVTPNFPLPTAQARAALPKLVPMSDAVFNIGRAVLVVDALEQGDFSLLKMAMDDRLHQPYRRELIPGYTQVAAAAVEAGAAAVALSGAGPSLIAFAPDRHGAIAAAMNAAFRSVGVGSRAFILPLDRQGVRLSVAG
jgi:homoserine kinase